MRRGTTPTLTFIFPFEVSGAVKDLRITFVQNDETVLEKKIEDCTLDGEKVVLKLTQEDTLKFDENEIVKIQVKFVDYDGGVLASKPINKRCYEIFNEEILK